MGRPPGLGPPRKLIGFKLPPELVEMIRQTAAASGDENSKLVEAAVRHWLARPQSHMPAAMAAEHPKEAETPAAAPAEPDYRRGPLAS
jgi:hypothetical protein